MTSRESKIQEYKSLIKIRDQIVASDPNFNSPDSKVLSEKASPFNPRINEQIKLGNAKQRFKQLPENIQKDTKRLVKIIPKDDILADLTGLIPGVDKGIGFRQADRSIDATTEAIDKILAENNINSSAIFKDNNFYLRDNASNDLYLVGSDTFSFDDTLPLLLGVIGLVTGTVIAGPALAAITGIGLVGAAAAGGTLGLLAGSGTGAGISQIGREVAEGSGPGEFIGDVVGNVGADVAENLTLNKAVGLTLKAGLGGAKVAGGVAAGTMRGTRFIPGASKLGKYISEGVAKSPITDATTFGIKAAGDKIGKTLEPLKESLEPLKESFQKGSEAFINGNYINEIAKSSGGKAFAKTAMSFEQSKFGSFVLNIDPKILDVPKSAGAVDQYKEQLKSLENELKRVEAKIKSRVKASTKFTNLENKLQGQIGDQGKNLNREKTGNTIANKVNSLVKDKAAAYFNAFKQSLNQLIKKSNTGIEPLADKVIINNIDEASTGVVRQIEKKITAVKVDAERAGIKLEIDDIGKEQELLRQTSSGKVDLLQSDATEQSKLLNTAQETIESAAAGKDSALTGLADELEKTLNSDFSNPELVGKQLRDTLVDKVKEGEEAQRALFRESVKTAPKDTVRVDVSGYLGNIKNSMKAEGDAGTNFYNRLSKHVPDPENATPEQLLKLKNEFDDIFSERFRGDGTGFNKRIYTQAAEARGKLVSDEGNIFSKSGSKSLDTYLKGSKAKVARYDSFQDAEFADLVGTKVDLKTGNIVRGKATSKEVFDNFVNLNNKDSEAANRILGFTDLRGDKSFRKGLLDGFINDSINLEVKNGLTVAEAASKTANKLEGLPGQIGEKGGKNLIEIAGGESEASVLIRNIKEVGKTDVPVKPSDVPGFEQGKSLLGLEKQLGKERIAVTNTEAGLANKQQSLIANSENKIGFNSQVNELDNLQKGVQDLQKGLTPNEGLQNLKAELDNILPKELTGEDGLPFLEQIRLVLEKNPQAAETLFKRAGVTDLDKLNIFKSLFSSSPDAAGRVSGISGADGLAKISKMGPEGLDVLKAGAPENIAIIDDEITNLLKLNKVQSRGPELNKSIANLEKDAAKTRGDMARINSKSAEASNRETGKALGIAGLGAAAGIALPGAGFGLDLLQGLAGASLASPAARKAIVGSLGAGAGLVNSAVGGSIPIAAKLVGPAANIASNFNGGDVNNQGAQLLNQGIPQGATFTEVDPTGQMTKEQILQLLLGTQ